MPGNGSKANLKGQTLKHGGKGAKGHHDMMAKKLDMSKSTGAAGSGEKPMNHMCNTPNGQRVV